MEMVPSEENQLVPKEVRENRPERERERKRRDGERKRDRKLDLSLFFSTLARQGLYFRSLCFAVTLLQICALLVSKTL